MFAKNRRLERRDDIIDFLKKFIVEKLYNFSEEQEKKINF